jgi:hypothetical protein
VEPETGNRSAQLTYEFTGEASMQPYGTSQGSLSAWLGLLLYEDCDYGRHGARSLYLPLEPSVSGRWRRSWISEQPGTLAAWARPVVARLSRTLANGLLCICFV